MWRLLLSTTRDQLNSINWTLVAIRTWTLLYNAFTTSVWVSKKTYVAITDAFSEEVYVFFKGDSTPYDSRHITLDGPGIASVAWIYNKNTKTFKSSNVTMQTHAKYLEWLSASIQYNGLNLYSLDDVIEGTHYLDSTGTMPSNDILVAAWSLTSGIVLDKTIDLKLFIIHSDGREEIVSLWKQFQKEVKVEKKTTIIVGAADAEPKNEYFPNQGLREDLSKETSNAILRISEKSLHPDDIKAISEAKKSDVTDISGVAETGFTNGIPEVDFAKVD